MVKSTDKEPAVVKPSATLASLMTFPDAQGNQSANKESGNNAEEDATRRGKTIGETTGSYSEVRHIM